MSSAATAAGLVVCGAWPLSMRTSFEPAMSLWAASPYLGATIGSWRPQTSTVGATISAAWERRSWAGSLKLRHIALKACAPADVRVSAIADARAR